MSGLEAIAPVASAAATPQVQPVDPGPGVDMASQAASPTDGPAFGDIIAQGLDSVEARIDHADEMVRAFTLDQDVPVHQVTIALAEASLAVELALQVRTRVVEAYREVMNMQL